MAAPRALRGILVAPRTREWADGALDAPGTPPVPPVDPGPWPVTGAPWVEKLEDPTAPGLPYSSADPTLPRPDLGAQPLPGAYDGVYGTSGPVTGFGEEQQAVGRIMRFGNNGPDRSPGPGEGAVVDGPSYADELAAALAATGQQPTSDADLYTNLLLYR
jgi:hypothetical protein